jgi:succinoglycan biosynthesis transport protein ExoP
MFRDRASRRRVRYLVEAPLRRRRRVVTPVVVASLVAAALALLLPARYRAAALVHVEWSAADEGLLGEAGLDLAERRNLGVRRRITETAVLERAISETAPYAAGNGVSAPAAAQVERLRSDLRVRPMSSSSFVVEFEHRDPVTAALVPNALAKALVEQGGPVRFELLRPAIPPAAPESSDPVWFGFAGAVAGLLLGLGAALVAEHRDPSVKGPEDLEDILPVPLLATLPEVRERDKRPSRDAGL